MQSPGTVVIAGTAKDQDVPDNLKVWVVEAAPAGTPNWRELGRGFAPVAGGTLSATPLTDFGVGTYALRLDAYDGTGSAEDLGTLTVTETTWQVNPPVNHAPTAALVKPTAGVVLGGTVTVTGTASDPDAGDGVVWKLEYDTPGSSNWVPITQGTAAVTNALLGTLDVAGLPDGLYGVRLTVTDAAGLVRQDNYDLFVGDAKGWVPVAPPVSPRPTATIAAPADGTKLADGTVPVTGTVTNPGGNTLLGWRLDASRGGDARRLGGGTGAVSAGTFATLDPTALPDGDYAITLTAYDVSGVPAVDRRSVSVAGGRLKLGNFTLSFTDLTIPVAGISIAVNRAYDTLDADKPGDFGYGWRLELGSYKAEVDLSTVGEYYDGNPAFKDGTRVSVRRPDGQKDWYTF